MTHEPFFIPDDAPNRLRVDMDVVESGVIQHEVFYESSVNTIHDRPLFLGRSYHRFRFLVVGVCIGLVFFGLLTRSLWMQVVQRRYYQALAENNRLRHTPLMPRRGIVYDRQGKVLADNVSRFQVTLTPRNVTTDVQERELQLGEATRLLGMSIKDVQPFLNSTSAPLDEEVVIAQHLSYSQAMNFAIALPHLSGFDLQVGAERRYPFSEEVSSLSHVLGYVGKLSPEEYKAKKPEGYRSTNEIGKTGIERFYEAALRGTPGERVSEVDAHGSIKAMVGDHPAIDGQDVHLTLDAELQRVSELALRNQMDGAEIGRGAVIAMDPRDGSILSLVSLPTFNNNNFSGGVSSTIYKALIENPDQPLFPRAWAGTYPSGSTVKIVISAAALAEKLIDAHTSVVSIGGIRVGASFFPDWKEGGHGVTDVRYALAWSVNTFFYTIGGGYESFVGLGVDRLHDWMERFGLGSKTGIDIPGEGTGFVPSKKWKQETKEERWYVGDTYNLSIGQGDLLVTPLQVANYTAIIANGGKKVTPHLVGELGEDEPAFPTSSIQDLNSNIVQIVRLGMKDCVQFGSCRGLLVPFTAGGKTGTAQWNVNKKTHAWFTSFAPWDRPEIVVTVLLEEGGEGSAVAVPVARQILQKWGELKNQRGGMF